MREATIGLSDAELEALGFGDLVGLCREAGVRDVEMLEDRGRTCVPQVELETRLDAERLDELECVDDWDLVAERDGTYLYLFELTATELPETAREDHEDLIGACDPTVLERGILLSLVGPQDAIRRMLANFRATGAAPEIHRLADYEGEDSPLDALTERQREAIATAYELGFYEVPREATTEDVAAALGVDPATLSEHLQRAERNLLTHQFPS